MSVGPCSPRCSSLALTVVGAFGFPSSGSISFRRSIFDVLVTTRLPGAAPEQVETEVTDKIEEAVNTISGIDTLTSTSSEGVSQVIVAFQLEKNADVATQEVRDRVNRILPLLPRTITQPTVEKRDPDAAPVLTVALTANARCADHRIRRQEAAPPARERRRRAGARVAAASGRSTWLDAAVCRRRT